MLISALPALYFFPLRFASATFTWHGYAWLGRLRLRDKGKVEAIYKAWVVSGLFVNIHLQRSMLGPELSENILFKELWKSTELASIKSLLAPPKGLSLADFSSICDQLWSPTRALIQVISSPLCFLAPREGRSHSAPPAASWAAPTVQLAASGWTPPLLLLCFQLGIVGWWGSEGACLYGDGALFRPCFTSLTWGWLYMDACSCSPALLLSLLSDSLQGLC